MKLQDVLLHNKKMAGTRVLLGILCLCFAAGFLAGRILYREISPGPDSSLASYLQGYAQLVSDASDTPASVLQVCMTYFRYPVLLFFFAFCAIGVYLIPAVCFMQGFFLSFALACFSGTLGELGVRLAFAAFGIRCLFLLPCCLCLALWAFRNAAAMQDGTGRGTARKTKPTKAGFGLRPVIICFSALCIGVLMELIFVPRLFHWLLMDLM